MAPRVAEFKEILRKTADFGAPPGSLRAWLALFEKELGSGGQIVHVAFEPRYARVTVKESACNGKVGCTLTPLGLHFEHMKGKTVVANLSVNRVPGGATMVVAKAAHAEAGDVEDGVVERRYLAWPGERVEPLSPREAHVLNNVLGDLEQRTTDRSLATLGSELDHYNQNHAKDRLSEGSLLISRLKKILLDEQVAEGDVAVRREERSPR